MGTNNRTHWVIAAAVTMGIFYVACGGGEDEPDVCVSVSDCPAEFRCINNECVPAGTTDAGGGDTDAGDGDMDAGGDDMDAGGDDMDAGGGTDSGPSDAAIDAPMSGSI